MEPSEYEHMADAERWHPWFVGRRRLVCTLISRYSSANRRALMLDAGCGTGWNLLEYARLGPCFGIEPDRQAAAKSYRRSGRPVVQGDLRYLPFRSGTFGLVVCTDVLEHIEHDGAALNELARVLVPGGILILTVPAYQWAWTEHDRYLGHVRRYDSRRLLSLLSACNFWALHYTCYNSVLGIPLILVRRLTSRSAGRSDVGRPVPRPIIWPLSVLFQFESSLAARLKIPFGLTHVVVARKRAAGRPAS